MCPGVVGIERHPMVGAVGDIERESVVAGVDVADQLRDRAVSRVLRDARQRRSSTGAVLTTCVDSRLQLRAAGKRSDTGTVRAWLHGIRFVVERIRVLVDIDEVRQFAAERADICQAEHVAPAKVLLNGQVGLVRYGVLEVRVEVHHVAAERGTRARALLAELRSGGVGVADVERTVC